MLDDYLFKMPRKYPEDDELNTILIPHTILKIHSVVME